MPTARLAQIDLNLLVTLDLLLVERSVTRAAARLGITQSAASHRLRKLRELFEDELFVAAGAGLVPTERADALRAPLRGALNQLLAALDSRREFDPLSARRRFVVASSDYAELAVLPHLLPRLRDEAPGVDVVIEPPGPSIPSRLESGELDLAIGPPLQGPSLRAQRMAAEGFVLALRRDHPASRGRLTLERYLGLTHLLVAPRGHPGGIVDDLLAMRGLERRVGLTIGHFSTAPFIVAATDLVWTAPEQFVKEAGRYVELTTRPLPLEVPPFQAQLTWHERAHRDPGNRWLREQLRT